MDFPKRITKVYTKYDSVPLGIYFPTFKDIGPFSIDNDTRLGDFVDYWGTNIYYGVVGGEVGLEGVQFIHYER